VEVQAFLTMTLNGSEWSASQLSQFTPRERAPGNSWTGGWVGPRTSLNVLAKRRNPCLH